MNTLSLFALVFVAILVLGHLMKFMKVAIIALIIVMIATGGYAKSLTSIQNIAKTHKVQYVYKKNAEDTLKVIPVFEDGKSFPNTSIGALLNGPKKYIVEYSSEKLVVDFKKSYNEVRSRKG